MIAPRVTLSTDFGALYPGAMRGVLAKRGIDRVIDVTHELPRQDVLQGGFWLQSLLPYFPPSVHCVVVDPGVGSDRGVLAIRAGGHVLIGPDNGVMWPVAEVLSGTGMIETFAFEHVDPDSATFHGRDVFAPLAAAVAHLGIDEFHRLPTISKADTPNKLTLPSPQHRAEEVLVTALAIDGFGNVITNLPATSLSIGPGDTVEVGGVTVPYEETYGSVEPGAPLLTVGSHGYVELAVNQGRGDDHFDIEPGVERTIKWATQ